MTALPTQRLDYSLMTRCRRGHDLTVPDAVHTGAAVRTAGDRRVNAPEPTKGTGSRMNEVTNATAALAALSSLFSTYAYSLPQTRGTSHLNPSAWPRKFGGRKAGRAPLQRAAGARAEFLGHYAGRRFRHRFTGEVRDAHDSNMRCGMAFFDPVPSPRGFYRSYRSAMKWLRNASEVRA